jgi:hypothetical protein
MGSFTPSPAISSTYLLLDQNKKREGGKGRERRSKENKKKIKKESTPAGFEPAPPKGTDF